MKKIYHYSILLLSLTLMSCGDDSNGDPTPSPSGGGTEITATSSISLENVPSEGAQFTLTVTSNGDWRISSDSQWITHFPSGGVKNEATEVKVTVAENTGFDSRDGALTIKSGSVSKVVNIHQISTNQLTLSSNELMCGSAESELSVTVNSNVNWEAVVDVDWCIAVPSNGIAGKTEVVVKTLVNDTSKDRTANVTFKAGESTAVATVTQYGENIVVPEGYAMVWHDEFNEGTKLNSDWTIEVQPSGWVNNELQNYVNRPVDGKNKVELKNGFLNINCFKASDGKIYSGRVYAKARSGWTYGYFEARINLPSGKGTWPAFWMMPVNFTSWPDDGEMDIMEEVGVVPNEVSSSLHALGHVHTNNTQVTKARMLPGAEGSFNTYAMEWTPDKITTYVNGQPLLTYYNDGGGEYNWPYNDPFYVILNLAWGGSWGGMNGVDESALPVTLLVDYVRVFQKK